MQPYVALGIHLQRAGHSVRLAAPELFRSFVSEYGLDFAPLAGDPRLLMQGVVDKSGGRPNLLRNLPVVLKYAMPLALQLVADARQACQGAQAIIHSFLTTLVGHGIAREMGIPDLSALLFAVFSPTTAFPNPTLPPLPLGGWYNRFTHEAFTQVYWQGSRFAFSWTTRSQRLARLPLEWPFAASNQRPTPILYAFSPALLPKPPDWGARTHVTGFWDCRPRQTGHRPPSCSDSLRPARRPSILGLAVSLRAMPRGSPSWRWPPSPGRASAAFLSAAGAAYRAAVCRITVRCSNPSPWTGCSRAWPGR